MPKIVDHEQQRHVVAEAALRVIRRSGLEHATVRNIAMEAGLSVGSMRHYFSTQAELFAFCMNLFLRRIEKRIETMTADGPVLLDLKRLLMQFLPVDEDRKTEMEVWLSFNAKALIHPELKALSNEMHDGLYKASRFVVDTLLEHNLAMSGLDADMETEKLYALIDGLAVHQIMQPGRLSTEWLESVIEQHLNLLCGMEEK
ncbi:TetR/AcrR family transcriptional regulator [Paenibacillus chitinolyticus]|uniref:TetR/AcrR family transcriptional regulator n=1 Tax=Paenibacillus chitinolyticus TaxID=79263 RepID=UPI00364AA284